MAVPKHKTSKQRSHTRHSNNSKAHMPNLVECPHCHGLTQSHTVCKCGYYDGKLVVDNTKADKDAE